jgi:hypothetical protein
MLDEANNSHANIKLVRQISTSTSFLDVYIENKNGVLAASVYHKQAAEPYIVPFKSDHPRHVFANIIDNALMRAIRYSSTLSAFNQERRSIKLMLLYNGYFSFNLLYVLYISLFSYPPRYIHKRFMNFFKNQMTISYLLPIIATEQHYNFIRDHLLHKPTITENQIASRISKTIEPTAVNEMQNSLLQVLEPSGPKLNSKLILHYKHEARLARYKTDFHDLWTSIFKQTEVLNTKVIIGNKIHPNIAKTLVRKRPQYKSASTILQNENKQTKN